MKFKYEVQAHHGHMTPVLVEFENGRRFIERDMPHRFEIITEAAYASLPDIVEDAEEPEDREVDFAQDFVTFDCLGIDPEACLTLEALQIVRLTR